MTTRQLSCVRGCIVLVALCCSLFFIELTDAKPRESFSYKLDFSRIETFFYRTTKSQNPDEVAADPPANITRYPVVLIPGYGGNQLYSKINKTSAPHYFCQLKSDDYFLLWFNLEDITPYIIDCFVDNLRLVYDNKTKQTFNREGVHVKAKDFGMTYTVENLDTSNLGATVYFGAIVDALVKKFNYVRGVNVRGAPYDWRKAPNELTDFYANLTQLVEETYYMNNGTKVMLMAHSMGNPVALYWLNNLVTQEWKNKFLKSMVSLAGVWGGAAKTWRVMASGDNIDIFVVEPIRVREYQRSAPSSAFLMPSDKFWSPDEVIVSRPSRNYTVKDYLQFFTDINYLTGYELHQNTKDLIYDFQAPNIELHCLYGVKYKTPERFVFLKEKDFPDTQPSVVYGDGDGTVNLKSLRGYERWMGKQKQPIKFQEFEGVEHLVTLKHPPIIDYILNLFYN